MGFSPIKQAMENNSVNPEGHITISPATIAIDGIIGTQAYFEVKVLNGHGILQSDQEVVLNLQSTPEGLSFKPFSALLGKLVEASSTMAKIKTNDHGVLGLLIEVGEVDSTFLPQNQILLVSTTIRDTQAPYDDVKLEARVALRVNPK